MSYELLMRTVSAGAFLALGSLLTTTMAIAASNVGPMSKLAHCRLLACPATLMTKTQPAPVHTRYSRADLSIRR